MNPSTRRRTVLAVILVMLIGLSAVAGKLVHQRRQKQEEQSQRLREQGLQAARDQDFGKAAYKLGKYLSRHSDDATALFEFAQARRQVQSPDGQNLIEAINALEQALRLEGKQETALLLLELYNDLGLDAKAIDLADNLLQRDPNLPQALQAKALAFYRTKRYPQALECLDQLCQVQPLNLTGQLLVASILQREGKSDELLQRAQKLAAAHPKAPLALTILGIAQRLAGQSDAAVATLQQAAALASPDPELARTLVQQLDELGHSPASVALLARLTKEAPQQVELQRMHLQRMWERQQHQQVVEQLAQLPTTGPGSDSRLLALRALARIRLKQLDQAKADAQALAQGSDPAATAWTRVLPLLMAAAPASDLLTACRAALEELPDEPVLLYLQGQAYEQLGEAELALQSWTRSAQLATGWAAPCVRITLALVESGRLEHAAATGQLALRREPGNVEAAVALAVAWEAMARSRDLRDCRDLLQLVAKVQEHQPGEAQTLLIPLAVRARLGERAEAMALGRSLLNQPSVPQELIYRLAALSTQYQLGLESACYQVLEQKQGLTPQLCLALVLGQASAAGQEQAQRAVQRLREQAASHPDDAQWQVAWARYLDERGDSQAARAAWTALTQRFPQNNTVQLMALRGRQSWSDPALIDQVILRLQERSPERGVSWRLARARCLLSFGGGERDLAQAAVLLHEVLNLSPTQPAAKLMLARVLEGLGNLGGALEQLAQLREQVSGTPQELELMLQQAQLQLVRGDLVQARQLAGQVAAHPRSQRLQRRAAALALLECGELQQAVTLLEAVISESAAGAAGDQAAAQQRSDLPLLAQLYQRIGQTEKAAALAGQLLEQRTPAAALQAAGLYAGAGDQAGKDRALAQLRDLGLSAGEQALWLGRFALQQQQYAQAAALYQTAVQAQPEQSEAWRGLIASRLYLQDRPQALAALDQALGRLPADKALQQLQQWRNILAWATDELAPMAAALALDPAGQTVLGQALGMIAQEEKDGAAATAAPAGSALAQLQALADAQPRDAALQQLLVRQCLQAGAGEQAARTAAAAAQRQPGNAALARLAVRVLLQQGNYEQALAAARRWRSYFPAHTREADIAAAQALLGLNQVGQAAQALAAHLGEHSAPASAEVAAELMVTQARILAAAGQRPAARKLLQERLDQGPLYRSTWQSLALAQDDLQQAAGDLQSIEALTAGQPQEILLLADSWHRLWQRSGASGHLANSRRLLEELARPQDAGPRVLLVWALVCQESGDNQAAEQGYRRVLVLRPGQPEACNNLAMLLSQRGQWAQAQPLAQQAAEARPEEGAFRETLAQIQFQGGDFAAAAQNLRAAISAEPGNLLWRARLVEALVKGQRWDEAQQAWAVLTDLSQRQEKLPAELAQKLKALDGTLRQYQEMARAQPSAGGASVGQ